MMEVSTFTVSAVSIAVGLLAIGAWKVVDWVWLRPKKLEKYFRQQGLSGSSYTLFYGDVETGKRMLKEALSKPISVYDDIKPRIMPYDHHSLKVYGKDSFMWIGPIAAVNIMRPELIKEIFNKHKDFQKPSNPLEQLLANGLVSHEGEKWVTHRRIINPAFHMEKLKLMLPAFYSSCMEMVDRWDELALAREPCEVDAWVDIQNMTRDVISRTAFGSSFEEGRRIFELQEEQSALLIKTMLSVYIPGWSFVPTKTNRRMKNIEREVRGLLMGIIRRREKAIKAGEDDGDDVLGLLLESNMKQDVRMSIDDVIEECKLFYFAGQETTSVLLVWTMVLLSLHTDWQAKAREEVLRVFGSRKPEFDELSHLKIVNMILNEVMRLYPPVLSLQRKTVKETKLGKLTLPEGVLVSIPTLLVHHDQELWGEDAMEFKPERFAEGIAKATDNRVMFFPFGGGPRICIGQNFALIEARVALSLILQRFTFELSPSYAHAPENAITLQPQHGAQIILHKAS